MISRRGFLFFLVSFLCVLSAVFFPVFAFAEAQYTIEELSQRIVELEAGTNHLWVAVAIMVIFLMKGGYLLFEAGLVRAKNTVNTAQKNLSDTLISTVIFYIIGYNIMFGESIGGWFGWTMDLEFHNIEHTFFLYQIVFCSMVATVVSGALAERIKFESYIISTLFITMIVYPVFGHWAWGDKVLPENSTYLIREGFIDFAGGTVVCAVGGWVSLAGLLVIGPRVGKYNEDGTVNKMPANNVVLAGFGGIVIWVGALAFNSGLAHAGSQSVAHIMSNTILVGAFSGLSSLIAGRLHDGLFRPERCIYGMLGGLAAIAAGCHIFSVIDTIIVGITSGLLVSSSFYLMVHKFKLDDVVSAIPINGLCGAWGTLLIGPLGIEEMLGDNTRMEQAWIQFQGVSMSFLWAFPVTFIFFLTLNKFFGIRVSAEDEEMGLNTAEHGVTMGTGVLQERFKDIVYGDGDLTKRLDETTGDEAAEIAYLFNRFVGKIQYVLINIEQNSKIITSSAHRLMGVSDKFSEGFRKITEQSHDVSETTDEIAHELEEISSVIGDVSRNVGSIASNANQMSGNVRSVSNDISELTSSIEGIASNTTEASSVAERAETMINNATQAMESLGQTATSIDSILEMINNIAAQTNMLALNATIEASRAGEAGKGFAVVANEVKSLANETAKATEGISDKIVMIQRKTGDASSVIKELNGIISTINNSLGSISQQVEAQSASTQNISANITETAEGAEKIAGEIGAIAQGSELVSTNVKEAAKASSHVLDTVREFTSDAKTNDANAQDVKTSVQDLASISNELTKIVNQYKIKDTSSSDEE